MTLFYSVLRHGFFFGLTWAGCLAAIGAVATLFARKLKVDCDPIRAWSVLAAVAAMIVTAAVLQWAFSAWPADPALRRFFLIPIFGLVAGNLAAENTPMMHRRRAWLWGLAGGLLAAVIFNRIGVRAEGLGREEVAMLGASPIAFALCPPRVPPPRRGVGRDLRAGREHVTVRLLRLNAGRQSEGRRTGRPKRERAGTSG